MITLWSSEFCLIIPKKVEVLWQHQTAGVACNQIYIEGVMIPLEQPKDVDKLLRKLQGANYNFNDKKIRLLWARINDELDFEYEQVSAPEDQPYTQEGLKWIQITKIKEKVINGQPYLTQYANEDLKNKYGDLIGKRIAFIYPNCD